MRTSSYLLLLILALLIAAFFGALAYFTYTPPDLPSERGGNDTISPPLGGGVRGGAPPTRPVISSSDPIRGNPAAPITIVEFGDFLCPACAEIAPILEKTLNDYKDNVRLIWKDFPNIRRHPLSQRAAQAARCAQEQGKFWQYHDQLLAQTSQGQSLTEEGLSLTAREIGLNSTQLSSCLASNRTRAIVERNLNEALLLGADATPYLFIGNERLSGAVTEAEIKTAIDNAL